MFRINTVYLKRNIRHALFLLYFMSMGYLAKAQKSGRFADFRGGDSVWVVKNMLFSPTRFFIGEEKVNFTTWRDHLQKDDLEVSKLLNKGTRLRKASTLTILGGLAATTAGILMQINSKESGNVNEAKRTAGAITLGVGIAASGTAIFLGQSAWIKYERAMRKYNDKVLVAPKPQLSLRVLVGPTMAAVILQW